MSSHAMDLSVYAKSSSLTVLRTADRKQFYPKPMVPMESQDSEDVHFASLESLWLGIWQI